MDRIVELLKAWAFDEPGYNLLFNSVVTTVKATSRQEFATAALALDEAERFAASLLDDEHALANRVELNAQNIPMEWGEGSRWRANVDVVLCHPDQLLPDGGMLQVLL